MTLLELGCQVVGLTTMLLGAWYFRSAWTLVLSALAFELLRTPLTHLILRGSRCRVGWNREAARELFRFGRWILVSTILGFLALQADRLLLSLFANLATVGLYSVALGLARFPRDLFSRMSNWTIFPMLSELAQRSRTTLDLEFRRVRRVLLPLGLLFALCVSLGAPIAIELLYDERYAAAAPVASLLGISVWFSILQVVSDRYLLALGRSRPLAVANLARFATSCVGSIIGFFLAGLSGFAVGIGAGALAGYLCIARRLHKDSISVLGEDAFYTVIYLGLHLTGYAALALPTGGNEMFQRAIVAAACLLVASGLAIRPTRDWLTNGL